MGLLTPKKSSWSSIRDITRKSSQPKVQTALRGVVDEMDAEIILPNDEEEEEVPVADITVGESAVESVGEGAGEGALAAPPSAAQPQVLPASPAKRKIRQPPQNSYLQSFVAPEAYGKKKEESELSRITKQVEERQAKIEAEKERAKRRNK
eukprot:CAMPEP_0174752326 /NCGR_PEP_ID=MMETSP1094-20130205/101792_1 /TAXON_ID=156173 /ORGANISM="Chrysochromulina brevifilum, Strain UTEX LB 985" /LENGTH=150 /DNA_ID=CAMNT_0015957953 /DNA_START=101 /DNA_END=550 /DNA_ORIENTATION=+